MSDKNDVCFRISDDDGGMSLDVYLTDRNRGRSTVRFVGNGTEFSIVDVEDRCVVRLGNGLLDAMGEDAAIPKGSRAADLLEQCMVLANRHDQDLATSIRVSLGGVA